MNSVNGTIRLCYSILRNRQTEILPKRQNTGTLSRFIIADLTDPVAYPQELQAIVPDLEVPMQPLLLEAKREYSMFVDFRKYDWVLPIYLYKDRKV